jgi:hypothetical protein
MAYLFGEIDWRIKWVKYINKIFYLEKYFNHWIPKE